MIAKVTMKALCSFIITLLCGVGSLSAAQQWKDTIVVARDGTGDYRTLTEAMEGIRAFMDYKVTVLVKKGVYKEKVILPSWLENVDFIGENVENTIITYDYQLSLFGQSGYYLHRCKRYSSLLPELLY